MRVLFACCVVLFSTAFSSVGVQAGDRPAPASALPGVSPANCTQCSALAEQHELLVAKIATLRGKQKSLEALETSLVRKRQTKQDALFQLQSRYGKIQQDELALGTSPATTSVKATRAILVTARKRIEREEFEIRADLVTLGKAVPQARSAARNGEKALATAITERLTVMQAMTNCEQRCVVADGPGVLVFTAASLTDIAQSNQSAIRRAARNTPACRDCNRLREQIGDVTRQIAQRKQRETGIRSRMNDLDKQRQAIRNEWRDLYNRYSSQLVTRLNASQDNGEKARIDQNLSRISGQIINVNTRRQRLLTREGQLQDELMRSGRQRDRLNKERRRLRAALGACEELCVAGERDPATAGLRLAAQRVNIAKAEAKCARCGSLARLVNDATAELGPLTTRRDALQARFARVAPALEQIQARRRSIIKYAGELTDLMEEFRQSGDVSRAKRELSQISARSQRLSTDIVRILDQRDRLEERIDSNANAITRLSILVRQRRRQFQDCETRCSAPDTNLADLAITRPDLDFATPQRARVRCQRCTTLGRIVDQLALIQQSEQASLTVTQAQLKVHQARLMQADRALALNTQSIRNARNNSEARASSERRNLIEGLQGEARAIRAERVKFLKNVDGARITRDTIRARISVLTTKIRDQREALASCETSCRIVAEAPLATVSKAQSLIRRADNTPGTCSDCDAKATAMREFVADIRSDSAKLETANRMVTRNAGSVTAFDRQIASNRTTVLSGVRGWFNLNRPADRKRRIQSVVTQAANTARLAKKVEAAASTYVTSSNVRDKAQTSLASTLPSLESAIATLQACAAACEREDVAGTGLNLSDFEEKDPSLLVVAPVTPANVRSTCAGCATHVATLNRAALRRARAAARVATARNITRSSGRINRRIAVQNRGIRNRIATIVKQRFLEQNEVRKAALRKRLDILETETRQLDGARAKQESRLRDAAASTDEARQDIRQLDRVIAIARTALDNCETTCKIASTENGEKPGTTDTGNGKDIARLPGGQTPPDNAETGRDVADAGTGPDTPAGETGTDKPERVSTACARCAVFSKRINTLADERKTRRAERDGAVKDRQRLIQTIRVHSGSARARTVLIKERRTLTRLIEARNTTIDRIESRLRRLRVSLARCEEVCNAPQEVAANDNDANDSDANDSDADPATKPRRRSADRIVVAGPSLPRRKSEPDAPAATPRIFGSLITLLTRDAATSGEWETSVDVAIGGGNVWAPESATLSVLPATSGNGDVKLDARTFAVTVTARDFGINGRGAVAWGSLEVTRADARTALTGATRDTDYTMIRGTVGLGRDIFDCLENGGYCTVGLMAGIEHTSFDDRLAAATASRTTSLDNTALLAGVWGEMRIPLGGFDSTGVALILKGDAYVKGGYASGTIATAAIAGNTTARASSGFAGAGADLSAELEFAFDQGAIAIGGRVGVDTLPTISQSGASASIDNDTSTSATVYIRGTLKF